MPALAPIVPKARDMARRMEIALDTGAVLEVELVEHFFRSLAENASMTLHMDLLRHRNAHHAVEGLFKAFARALAMAIGRSRSGLGIPSTKGVL